MNKFECYECGHIVKSTGDEVPPIHWSDGHSCDFTKMDEKKEEDDG